MISFDWAMKRLLSNKANFKVLEGFLNELLGRKSSSITSLKAQVTRHIKTTKPTL